ncbi:MAG: hypothetical protein QOJ62_1083, partial [Actinomycetota bacterium]|nr:hypothetical protein [Actinomycetota bacterium]
MSDLPALDRPPPLDRELAQVCIRNLLVTTADMVYFKDLQSRFIALSDAVGATHGRAPEELIGLTDFDVSSPEHAAAAYADEQYIIATGNPIVNKAERESLLGRSDSWATSTKHPLRDADGRIIGTFGVSRDITRLVRAEADATRNADALALAHLDLGQVEAQLRTVLDTSSDSIALYDQQLRYQYLNAAAKRSSGDLSADRLGQTDRELGRDEEFLAIWEVALLSVLATGEGCTVEVSLGSGEKVRWFAAQMAPQRGPDDAAPVGVVASAREVTELRRVQNELAHQAVHDPLTGLANRVLLMDRLTQALLRMDRQPGPIAVLFVDLDHFKEINDTYGHDAGDRVLVEVAARLTALSRRSDTVARLGGDEFVVLGQSLSADDDVRVLADRVVRSLSEPFVDSGRELYITASVGV